MEDWGTKCRWTDGCSGCPECPTADPPSPPDDPMSDDGVVPSPLGSERWLAAMAIVACVAFSTFCVYEHCTKTHRAPADATVVAMVPIQTLDSLKLSGLSFQADGVTVGTDGDASGVANLTS